MGEAQETNRKLQAAYATYYQYCIHSGYMKDSSFGSLPDLTVSTHGHLHSLAGHQKWQHDPGGAGVGVRGWGAVVIITENNIHYGSKANYAKGYRKGHNEGLNSPCVHSPHHAVQDYAIWGWAVLGAGLVWALALFNTAVEQCNRKD